MTRIKTNISPARLPLTRTAPGMLRRLGRALACALALSVVLLSSVAGASKTEAVDVSSLEIDGQIAYVLVAPAELPDALYDELTADEVDLPFVAMVDPAQLPADVSKLDPGFKAGDSVALIDIELLDPNLAKMVDTAAIKHVPCVLVDGGLFFTLDGKGADLNASVLFSLDGKSAVIDGKVELGGSFFTLDGKGSDSPYSFGKVIHGKEKLASPSQAAWPSKWKGFDPAEGGFALVTSKVLNSNFIVAENGG